MNYRKKSLIFPGGRTKALTMSYDDGITQDKKLIQIFDKYGIKGTFNLNSGCFGTSNPGVVRGVKINHVRIDSNEIKEVYKNHEVAVHTLTHPHLKELPKEVFTYEVMEDKKNLEEIVGYPVRGMAYPFGDYDDDIIETLKELKIEYSRTVKEHENFKLPQNYLALEATCHHNNTKLLDLAKAFIDSTEVSLFYVWGHSYEFDADNNWDKIEEFCKLLGNNDKIWYATNIQIVDYINAVNSLKFSCTGSSIFNPSGQDVWVNINGNVYKIEKGTTLKID